MKRFLSKLKKGIKVILDGTDGDSVISHGTEIFRYYGETFQIKNCFMKKRHMIIYTIENFQS